MIYCALISLLMLKTTASSLKGSHVSVCFLPFLLFLRAHQGGLGDREDQGHL